MIFSIPVERDFVFKSWLRNGGWIQIATLRVDLLDLGLETSKNTKKFAFGRIILLHFEIILVGR
jgi:hypothetical protein